MIKKSILLHVVNLIIYPLLVSISLIAFWLFRPFTYIDNFNSYVYCNNGIMYQAGSNFIFSTDGKLDPFNDKKARKICDYSIIADYQDVYTTSKSVNYNFSPVNQQESNWIQAGIVFLMILCIGWLVIESLKKIIYLIIFRRSLNYSYHFQLSKNKLFALLLFLTISLVIFILFLKKPSTQLYCLRKTMLQVDDFKRAANKSGRLLHITEQEYIKKVRSILYTRCIGEDV